MRTFCRTLSPAPLLLGFMVAALDATPAAAQTPIKFLLAWTYEPPTSSWTLAQTSGCFKRNGLDVTIDGGRGSGDTLSKVAAGAYDIGVADFSVLVSFNAKFPNQRMIATLIINDRAPNSIVALKTSGITKPKDVVNKNIADNVGEASRELFPAFAKANGIDPNSVNWVSVTPNLRETTLVRRQSDAAAGNLLTIWVGLHRLGLQDSDFTIIPYADWGVDIMGNAVVTKPAWAASHEDALKKFVACGVDALRTSVLQPSAAVDSLKGYNRMVDRDEGIAELEYSNRVTIMTDYVKANGLGGVDDARVDRALNEISDAFKVAKPAVDAVWNPAYLPPAAARRLKP